MAGPNAGLRQGKKSQKSETYVQTYHPEDGTKQGEAVQGVSSPNS
ncbi:MAG TPA: hypothetical protein VN414_02605 [Methanosarcina sp.]|nr:hypothetical protein [Methanosarcina sp.]